MSEATPRADGFAMPAEFSPHERTWMIWPERPDNWRAGAEPAQAAFAAVARAIARFEPVTMIASARGTTAARAALPAPVRVIACDTNDAWARDTGATFLLRAEDGALAGVDWVFNAWGGEAHGLYADWTADDAVAAFILREAGAARYRAPIVLEGGAIHVDGAGTLLTTEACLLDPARNPGITKARMEQVLGAYLGIDRVVWLGRGVPEDETGGHIDNLACFVKPGTVMLSWCDDPADPHHAVSRDAAARLEAAGLDIVKIPMPAPMFMTAAEAAGIGPGDGRMQRVPGMRLAASYVNFLLVNGGVIAPAFGTDTDGPAREVLAHAFPEREIVTVPGREILLGGGNIHCITQQQPSRPATAK